VNPEGVAPLSGRYGEFDITSTSFKTKPPTEALKPRDPLVFLNLKS
jgi:hypothetical protein